MDFMAKLPKTNQLNLERLRMNDSCNIFYKNMSRVITKIGLILLNKWE